MSIQSNFPAIKPSLLLDFANTKQLDPRVTFARATTATYYDGVTTAKAEENLFVRSQEFDNASWLKFNNTVTANTTAAPDGTTTADTSTPDTATNRHLVYQRYVTAYAGQTFTASVYVKANGYNYVAIGFEDDLNGVRKSYIFDLVGVSASVLFDSGNTIFSNASATIVSVGNGWFRCTMTATNVNTLALYLTVQISASPTASPTIAAGMPSFSGDGTSGLFLWGAQLEQRSSVTAYTATTTQAITNYIPVLMTAAAGVPRFDHNPTTDESLGLLIEEQRTNLLTYSADFGNAIWVKARSTITTNVIVAPDGTLSGDKLVEDTTASNSHFVTQIASGLSSSTNYTWSNIAKAGERNRILLTDGAGSGASAYFDLLNGTIIAFSTCTPTMTNLGNGWYRCAITFTTGVAQTSANCRTFLVQSGTNEFYTGDGFSGAYIWGAQLEAGSFATSYIPTVASTVTRNADQASMTGTNFSSWYSAGEGTIYADVQKLSPSSSSTYAYELVGASSSSSMRVRLQTDARIQCLDNGSVQVDFQIQSPVPTTANKYVFAYKFNDYAGSANGAAAVTDTSASVPAITSLQLGSVSVNSLCIRKIAYYPLRVTNAQLQALTS